MFDRYDNENYIKQFERFRCGVIGLSTHKITGQCSVPIYHKFLQSANNKAVLAVYICDHSTTTASALLEDGHNVILSGGFRSGQEVPSVMEDAIFQLGDLSSTHEEADT